MTSNLSVCEWEICSAKSDIHNVLFFIVGWLCNMFQFILFKFIVTELQNECYKQTLCLWGINRIGEYSHFTQHFPALTNNCVFFFTPYQRQIITKNQSYRLGSLEYDTTYCISAGTYSRYISLESHTSEWRCEKTPTGETYGGKTPWHWTPFVSLKRVCF